MFDTIVIPTDGSGRSRTAFERGVGLASEFGADCHLIHVVDTARFGEPALSSAELVVEERETEGEQVLKELANVAHDHGIHTEMHNCHGDPAREILAYADEVGADLLVLGFRGQDHRRGVGSVTKRVVDATQLPTLLV